MFIPVLCHLLTVDRSSNPVPDRLDLERVCLSNCKWYGFGSFIAVPDSPERYVIHFFDATRRCRLTIDGIPTPDRDRISIHVILLKRMSNHDPTTLVSRVAGLDPQPEVGIVPAIGDQDSWLPPNPSASS